jgi:hypothetical protein
VVTTTASLDDVGGLLASIFHEGLPCERLGLVRACLQDFDPYQLDGFAKLDRTMMTFGAARGPDRA